VRLTRFPNLQAWSGSQPCRLPTRQDVVAIPHSGSQVRDMPAQNWKLRQPPASMLTSRSPTVTERWRGGIGISAARRAVWSVDVLVRVVSRTPIRTASEPVPAGRRSPDPALSAPCEGLAGWASEAVEIHRNGDHSACVPRVARRPRRVGACSQRPDGWVGLSSVTLPGRRLATMARDPRRWEAAVPVVSCVR
jgi:hypothetical protein